MQLGMIGLGRMGANLVRRLARDGHECVVYDQNLDAVQHLSAEGAVGGLARTAGRETRPATRGLGDGARCDNRPRGRRAHNPARA
jgi:prephenate dehydrogenase